VTSPYFLCRDHTLLTHYPEPPAPGLSSSLGLFVDDAGWHGSYGKWDTPPLSAITDTLPPLTDPGPLTVNPQHIVRAPPSEESEREDIDIDADSASSSPLGGLEDLTDPVMEEGSPPPPYSTPDGHSPSNHLHYDYAEMQTSTNWIGNQVTTH
jgi:hypothetical protein